MSSWDAVVSWDKWATEWAKTNNMDDRLLAYYPQLFPMVSSVLYRLTGTASTPIPLSQYALHAFQPFTGFMLLIAVLRLGELFRLPAWPALLLLFGSATIRMHATAGAADLLAAALLASAIALFVSIDRACLLGQTGIRLFLALVFFGTLFVKANNFVLVVAVALTPLVVRRTDSNRAGPLGSRPGVRGLAIATALAILLYSTFVLHQYWNAGTPPDRLTIGELNFNPAAISEFLRKNTAATLPAESEPARIRMAAERIAQDYELFPGTIGGSLLIAAAGLLACARMRALWPLLATAVIQVAVWYKFTAYDTRNLIPAIPLLGLCITAGLRTIATKPHWGGVPRLIAFALLVPIASWMLARISMDSHRLGSVLAGEMPKRLQAMETGFRDRAALFYPQEFPTFQFITSLTPVQRSSHIAVGSRMYRWFANGLYPLSYWPVNQMLPGDTSVFLGPQGGHYKYFNYDQWTMIYEDPSQRAFLLDKNPKAVGPAELLFDGATPPKLGLADGSQWEVETTGPSGYLAYNLPIRDPREGDTVTWRVLVETDEAGSSGLAAKFVAYDPLIVDAKRTNILIDRSRITSKLAAYSGVITFADRPAPTNAGNDKISVGLATTRAGAKYRVREFRVNMIQERK
ncbi:MAG: hypothetical protein HYX27_10870 [Acidobacteria bacterium]|nr:hypothetical protein [Acidobacteriota bacterium]